MELWFGIGILTSLICATCRRQSHSTRALASAALLRVGPEVWVHGRARRVDGLARLRPTTTRVG